MSTPGPNTSPEPFVLLSFADSCDRSRVGRVCDRARAIMGELGHAATQLQVGSASDVVAFTARRPDDGYPELPQSGGFAVRFGRRAPAHAQVDSGTPSPTHFSEVSDHRAFDALAPPFALCYRQGPRSPVALVTDPCGLHHVYWHQAGDWAAGSTSSLLLARLSGAGLDELGIATLALLGHHLGDLTAYQQVHKIPAGHLCTFSNGRGDLRRYAAEPERFGRVSAVTDSAAVEEGVLAVRGCVESCLSDFPDAAIELSGGIDSRAVLAAIPPDARQGRRAITLTGPDSPDAPVAADIAAAQGLRHELVDLGDIALLTPEESLALTRDASRRRDHQLNPLGAAVLDWVEAQLPAVPRLTGQNGEYARGFYYSGQRAGATVTPERVARLARWRLLTNDASSLRVFRPGFREEVTAEVLSEIQRHFPAGAPWFRSTDEFYLAQRMQRWVGAGYSVAGRERPILAPFFQRPFIEWVRRTDPVERQGSGLFAEVVASLDPALAGLPLDSGLPVTALCDDRIKSRLRRGGVAGRKYVRKARQRLASASRPPSGAQSLAAGVLRAWRHHPDTIAALEECTFIDPSAIASILREEAPSDPTTVGFLVSLSGLVHDLQEPERQTPSGGLMRC